MDAFINNLSVDCVIFGFSNKTLNVLLTKRELKDPDSGMVLFTDFTVQGHHVYKGENINDAASRVLKDKTGFENIFLEQFYTFGDTDRVLKERDQLWIKKKYPMISDHVISVGYCSLVDSSILMPDTSHQDTVWFPIDELPELGFDHAKMISMALDFLRNKLRHQPIGFELLPEKFTLSEMQSLYEVILGTKIDRRNFSKKVAQMKFVIPLNEKQKGVAHRAAQVFIFSKDVYERTKKDKLILSY